MMLDITNHEFNEKALLHEMLHVLGLSTENLSYGPNGEKLEIFRKGLKNPKKTFLDIETVNSFAANYFNCINSNSTFEGVQIEDEN